MYNLKVENYVLFGGLTEDLSQGYSISDSFEGLFQRRKGGSRINRSFCGGKKNQNRLSNIKRLLLITLKIQTSQVNEFSAFLCMGKC